MSVCACVCVGLGVYVSVYLDIPLLSFLFDLYGFLAPYSSQSSVLAHCHLCSLYIHVFSQWCIPGRGGFMYPLQVLLMFHGPQSGGTYTGFNLCRIRHCFPPPLVFCYSLTSLSPSPFLPTPLFLLSCLPISSPFLPLYLSLSRSLYFYFSSFHLSLSFLHSLPAPLFFLLSLSVALFLFLLFCSLLFSLYFSEPFSPYLFSPFYTSLFLPFILLFSVPLLSLFHFLSPFSSLSLFLSFLLSFLFTLYPALSLSHFP